MWHTLTSALGKASRRREKKSEADTPSAHLFCSISLKKYFTEQKDRQCKDA